MADKDKRKTFKNTIINVHVKHAEDVGKVVTQLSIAIGKSRMVDQITVNVNGSEVPTTPAPLDGADLL